MLPVVLSWTGDYWRAFDSPTRPRISPPEHAMVARVQRLVIHGLCPAERKVSIRPQRLGPSAFPDTSTLEPTVPLPQTPQWRALRKESSCES